AGVNLAQLGETRKETMTVDEMTFCMVPGGEFRMGESGETQVNDSLDKDFWISRYPLTQAQFQEFVEDGGYKREEYWKEATDAGYWQDGKIKGRYDSQRRVGPYQFNSPFSFSNHPVVGVCWYEALAFTRWLNGKWQGQGMIPNTMNVVLPSEAEWEKAARGGLKIPERYVISSVNGFGSAAQPSTRPNPEPERTWPWEESGADKNRANYSDTGIGATSAVGCFPGGVSPYGCEEMSGNVWEWTRSVYGEYPYVPGDGREDLEASKEKSRVLRGGSFGNAYRNVRCANRCRNFPVSRSHDVGFRVLLSPF
ncbi:MAG: formylglycine-generating enzyme family protein, partial [Gammaproteobacteria bacterium]|nr:formylglycine-generating enzyme family protein [Gammaproteobacteria bacterium]